SSQERLHDRLHVDHFRAHDSAADLEPQPQAGLRAPQRVITLRVMKLSQRQASATCEHASTERLGSNYDALFLRCRQCGRVFVLQDGQVWSIPASPPAPEQGASAALPGTVN